MTPLERLDALGDRRAAEGIYIDHAQDHEVGYPANRYEDA
jgi:hypothetical protein